MQTLEQIQQYTSELIDNIAFTKQPLSLYEPIDYAMHMGGKRIRPLLTMIVTDMFDLPLEKSNNVAIAIELAHNFTLLHDDIMDSSPLRRGKPSVYQKFGTNIAILSGDNMFALAYNYLLKCDKDKIPALTQTLTSVMINICEGQTYDLNFELRSDVSKREYITMISLKTGILLAGALKMGAIIAGAKAEDINYLNEFGLYLGIAFQLQDDILDCWSDLNTFGKVTGTDIVDNKKTILYLTAIEKAEDDDMNELINLYSSKTIDFQAKLQRVKQLFEKYEVRTDVENTINQYITLALNSLDKVSVAQDKKENLRQLTKQLINRNK